MSRNPLLCPPQMRNGGSPPAHLSLSSDATIDSSGGWEEDVARLRSSYPHLRSRWEEENARLPSRWEENFCRLLNALIAEERRQQATTQTIFLWLRPHPLHVRLARQTSRRHHEITEQLRHAEEALGVCVFLASGSKVGSCEA
jgi:hypothetical protein